MNPIRNRRSSGTLMGLAATAFAGILGTAVGQSVAAIPPRLTIQEVAPASVEVIGGESRLLPNSASPAGLVGDQVNAVMASFGSTAFVVWQDNAIDGDGLGIGSRVLDLDSGAASPQILRVNQQALFDQQNPSIATLSDGSAIVAWQSGKVGKQSIHARRLSRTGAPVGDEWVVASADADSSHKAPVVVSLPGRGFAMAWQVVGVDGVSSKVHIQSFNLAGRPDSVRRVVGTSALVDRSPALAVLSNGDLAVAWVAEHASADVLNLGGGATRREANADIFAQILQADGTAASPIWINGSASPCDRPSVASLPSGRWLVGWSEFDLEGSSSWDVRAATLSNSGVVLSSPVTLNDYRSFDQNGLRLTAGPEGALAVWCTRGADGSGLGIAARAITDSGMVAGDEVLLNQTRRNDQFAPAVAVTPSGYRAVWSDFVGVATGVDLSARDLQKVKSDARQKLKITWNTSAGAKYRLETSASIDAGAASQSYFRVQSDR